MSSPPPQGRSPSATEAFSDDLAVTAAARVDGPPVSRLGRLARLGALAPRAIPIAAEAVRRAVGGRRSEDDEAQARRRLVQNAKKTADAMLKTLGEMKGLPLKLGQMASYIDGLAPPGYEERLQRVLARLQQKAPPLSAEAAVRVVREELGAAPSEIFARWESEPFAAASIGQVHRAVTRAGERVAVKVQYPGIDKAIENDLKSLSLLESMIAPIGRRYQSKEALEELRRVFMAEVDYRVEADAADAFRRVHEGDDAIVIPRIVHSLSSRRVLTLEMMDGVDYAVFAEQATAADRNAAGETLARFMFRALFRHGLLYADPHPGNYRFLGGGRVAFLDFGCHKRLAPHLVAGMKRYITALQRDDLDEFLRACVDVLGYDPSARRAFDSTPSTRSSFCNRSSSTHDSDTRRSSHARVLHSWYVADAGSSTNQTTSCQPSRARPHAHRLYLRQSAAMGFRKCTRRTRRRSELAAACCAVGRRGGLSDPGRGRRGGLSDPGRGGPRLTSHGSADVERGRIGACQAPERRA